MLNFVYFSLKPRNVDTFTRFAEDAAFDKVGLPYLGCSNKVAG
jgi:hypothetical protein